MALFAGVQSGLQIHCLKETFGQVSPAFIAQAVQRCRVKGCIDSFKNPPKLQHLLLLLLNFDF